MVKSILAGLAVFSLLLCSICASAGSYSFSPYPSDLSDLEHAKYYTWGIRWNLPANEVITEAYITYHDIYDWQVETDHLYTTILDTVNDPNGSTAPNYQWNGTNTYQRILIVGTDNEGGGDFFAGKGVQISDWNDPDGPYSKDDLTFYVPASAFSYLSDGNFGIGIDPDCHYYNCGVDFKIKTGCPNNAVPEPVSLTLGALGFAAFGGLRRLRK